MPIEFALVVLIPEAEPLVESFRKRFDPSAAMGVPAHVTVLYPFKPPDELTGNLTTTLRELFSKQPGFTALFSRIQQFPDALYLAPEPSEPFRQLTKTVVRVFPDTPPYRGAFKEIIPHLTVAQGCDLQQLKEITADFHAATKVKLPFHARVDSVAWMDNSSGAWQTRVRFSLHPESRGR